jgi:hypothetical protein
MGLTERHIVVTKCSEECHNIKNYVQLFWCKIIAGNIHRFARRMSEKNTLLSVQTVVQDAVTQLRATERGKYVTFIVDISCQGTPDILEEVEYFIVVFVCLCVLTVSTVTLCFKSLYRHLFQTENYSIFHLIYFYVASDLNKKWIISLKSTDGFVL